MSSQHDFVTPPLPPWALVLDAVVQQQPQQLWSEWMGTTVGGLLRSFLISCRFKKSVNAM